MSASVHHARQCTPWCRLGIQDRTIVAAHDRGAGLHQTHRRRPLVEYDAACEGPKVGT